MSHLRRHGVPQVPNPGNPFIRCTWTAFRARYAVVCVAGRSVPAKANRPAGRRAAPVNALNGKRRFVVLWVAITSRAKSPQLAVCRRTR